MTPFRPALFFGIASIGASALAAPGGKLDFNYDIQPIISSKCFHCHGPDEQSRKAKLRLDRRDDAVRERDGVRAVVPGDADASELVARIRSTDKDEVMPPPKEGKPLTREEIDLLKRWIEEGAEYKPHWAFTKPARPSIPDAPPLQADGVAPVKNPIDAFIRARLAKAGMAPSPEADRHTLIRRLSFDLTGLPPTPQEVREFVNDPADDAYEKLVDRLLQSPHFGEKWCRMWLDLARYADSTGYGSDKFRLNIWPWRDWVTNAFNRNLPYDQFTIEQLAGDLLPNSTPDQIAATAFHRNTMTNVEGGTIDEEYRVAAVKDRIATTAQTWMGLTLQCAQCHSHKFDPISQKEYYQFFAVFNQTEDSDREDEEPKMPLPTPDERARIEKLKSEIAAIESQQKADSPELEAELREWEAKVAAPPEWTVLEPTAAEAAGSAKLTIGPDRTIRADGDRPNTDAYTVRIGGGLHEITGFRIEVLPGGDAGAKGPGRFDHGNFVLSDLKLSTAPADGAATQARYIRIEQKTSAFIHLAEVQAFSRGENVALKGKASQSTTFADASADRAIDGKTDGDYRRRSVQHTDDGDKAPWWEVDLGAEQPIDTVALWNRTDSGLHGRIKGAKLVLLDAQRQPVWEQTLDDFDKESRWALNGEKSVPLRNASADYEQPGFDAPRAIDSSTDTGWAISGAAGQPHAIVVETERPLDAGDDQVLKIRLIQKYPEHTLGRFRISATSKAPPVLEIPETIKAVLAIEPTERDAKQRDALLAYFRPRSRYLASLQKDVDARRAALAAVKPVQLPIMRELAANKRRETHLLNKGNYLAPGDKVEPTLLSAFTGDWKPDGPITRLSIAQWLLSDENPLTARVAVNRFWSQLFGTGLVETEEDFGTQGALPSHPDLLDWLAVTFRSPKSAENGDAGTVGLGWDMKALIRLMVTSSTYRQSSRVTPEHLEKDARNRLLARFPRRRLDAEAVRDQALALSGLLSPKIGGPSVYPPQPDGLWNVAFNGGQNGYPTSKGEDRYRRGLYTFWRRTQPYPSMTTFDAPSRESCTLRRLPTNTPLQAFVTLNDPCFVECAQALARRIVCEGGADAPSRVRWALELALARPADAHQVTALTNLLDAEYATYKADPASAVKLTSSDAHPLPKDANPAELAAWTVVANVLLNLDGVLTKN